MHENFVISLELFGRPECLRYRKMRDLVLDIASQLGMDIQLEEINDTARLSQSSPLDLPRLVANGEVIASRNPPKKKVLTERLKAVVSP